MHSDSLNRRIEKAKGDRQEINTLVEEYKPFIASCVEKSIGRYVRYGEDDELSIGLMAFTEAVNSYDSSRGNFLALAGGVIKRRLIDYYRKEKKHSSVVHISHCYDEDDEELDLTAREAIDAFSSEEISEYRRLELEELKKELAKWDISFFELVDASPRQEGTRKIYADIIKLILSRAELIDQIKQKKYLPIAEIEKSTKIHRKKIERARKYIIAVIVILTGDYQYIQDYIDLKELKPQGECVNIKGKGAGK